MNLWTPEEDRLLRGTWADGYQGYVALGGDRSYDAWQKRRLLLSKVNDMARMRTDSAIMDTKKLGGVVDWRETSRIMRELQDVKKTASATQHSVDITIPADGPIVVMTLADTHIGSWSTDYDLFERITDEILSIPNLYLCLLGDMAHMAIKLRSVEEVSDNLLPPDLQLRYLESWLQEMQSRVLFATWGNHDIEREESQAGGSRFADLYRRMVPYFGGIGHAHVTVGSQSYRIAASHKFLGRSMSNPVLGPQNYLLREGVDMDIAMAGDSHVPGILQFTHGPLHKIAINAGSIQTGSGYAKRYFSLKTHPVFPVFTLDPEAKVANPYWSLQQYLRR